ncbi:unnamed protein product, partial [Didymodactylos carnosus]
PRLPIDAKPVHFSFQKPNDYFIQLQRTLKIYHKLAKENSIQQQQLSKNRYDLHRQDPHYKLPETASSSSVEWHEDGQRHTYRQQSSSQNRSYHASRQPSSHTHEHLVNRSEDNIPSSIPESKRRKWLKAGEKARAKHQLNAITTPFTWSKHHYGVPVLIDYLTNHAQLKDLIEKVKSVKLYMIDTEGDANLNRYSSDKKQTSTPALIQIQAIHSQ